MHKIRIRIDGPQSEWSKSFIVNQIGRIYLKCGRKGSTEEDLIRADIVLDGATFIVVLKKQESRWPFRIENESGEDIAIWQQVNSIYFYSRFLSLKYISYSERLACNMHGMICLRNERC